MAPSYWDSLDMPKNVSTPSVGTPQTPVSTSSSYWDNLDANVPVVRAPQIDRTAPASLGGGLSQSFTTGLGMMTGRLLDQILHASAQTIRGYEGLTDAQLGVIEKGFEKFGIGTKKLKELRETDFTGKLEQYREKLKRNIEVGADVSRETNPFASTFAGQTVEVLGGLVPQVGMALAGAPQVGLALSESVMNVEDSYDENIKKGMSKEDALKRAIPQLGADLAATYITNKLGTFSKLSGATNSMFKSRIAETLKDSSLEIAQEVWQQGLQNLATDKPFTQDMSETAKLTIVPALLFGVAGNIGSVQAQKETKEKVTQAISVMQQKIANGEKLTEQEQALQAVIGDTDPFVEETAPADIPPTLTAEQAMATAAAKIQQTYYHGSPAGKLSEIKSGKESGAGQQLDVPYLTKEKDTAKQYTIDRDIDDKGLLREREDAQLEYDLSQSESSRKRLEEIDTKIKSILNAQKKGDVTEVEFSGRTINPFSREGRNEILNILKNNDISNLTPKEQRLVSSILSNDSTEFLTSKVIDESPGVRKILSENNIHGLEYQHDPLPYSDGETGTQIAVLDKSKMSTRQEEQVQKKPSKIAKEKIAAQPVEATPLITKPSPYAKSLEQSAIKAGITKGFKDIAGYTPSTIEEQSALSSKVIEGGPENIISILNGTTSLPVGLKGGPFTVSIETWLKTNSNEEVAYALANSPLTSGVSEGASELGLMQDRNPDSAGVKIHKIRKAREERIGKVKTEKIKKATQKIVEATKEVNLSKEDLQWDNFLDSITC